METFSVRKTTEQFIAEAVALYGDKYDYSKVDYKTNKDKVCIICPVHGEFWQTPNDHLRGSGCKHCYYTSKRKFGVGVFDVLGACKENAPFYKVWSSIMLRATNDKHKNTHNAYKDCSICDEWLTLSNFKKWFEDPEMATKKGYTSIRTFLLRATKSMRPTSVVLCHGK